MGLVGQENHPDVWEAAGKIEAIVAPSSVALGELSRSNLEAAQFARSGYQLLCLGGDVGYMVAGAQVRSRVARAALGGKGANVVAGHQEGGAGPVRLVEDGRCEAIDVSIVVSSSAAGLGFYRDLLGMHHVEDVTLSSGDLLHRLRVGRSELKLLVPTSPPSSATGGWTVCGPSYVTLRVDNIEEIAIASDRHGVKIVRPLSVLRPGTEVLVLEDPDGTHVEFKRVAA
jgi:catechol 2,3-dioxygenase-like lactoylglutathione lyase family enzyme